jgi:hypothetical protein
MVIAYPQARDAARTPRRSVNPQGFQKRLIPAHRDELRNQVLFDASDWAKGYHGANGVLSVRKLVVYFSNASLFTT